jgi:hypothetical protein
MGLAAGLSALQKKKPLSYAQNWIMIAWFSSL